MMISNHADRKTCPIVVMPIYLENAYEHPDLWLSGIVNQIILSQIMRISGHMPVIQTLLTSQRCYDEIHVEVYVILLTIAIVFIDILGVVNRKITFL